MELVSMYRSIEALRDRLQEESDGLYLKVEDVRDRVAVRGIGLTVPEEKYTDELNQRRGRYDEAISHLSKALMALDRIDV